MIENETYLRAYFGNAADYYLKRYKAFHDGRRFSFNIGPFFAGWLWFLYRKLWSESIIIMLVMVLLGMLEQRLYPSLGISTEMQSEIFFATTLVLGIIYGWVGNYLYISKADNTIRQVMEITSSEDERLFLLSRSGGISWFPFAVAGFFAAVVIMQVIRGAA